MLYGEKVTLRATTREDLARLAQLENDLGFVLSGGWDPPRPVPLERLQREFEREASDPPKDKTELTIEADGAFIGRCDLYDIDTTARHAANERGIRAYRSCGFVEEGRIRGHVSLDGRYVGNVIMGVLREEWEGRAGNLSGGPA